MTDKCRDITRRIVRLRQALSRGDIGRASKTQEEGTAAPKCSSGQRRRIYVNTPLPQNAFDMQDTIAKYPPNQIRTAKYTIISFIPKNLFEQFRRVANIYFLLLLILQFVPAVSAGSPGLSAFALFSIVLLTMIKDGYEDSKRSASDRVANKAPTLILGGGWVNQNKPPTHLFRPRGLMKLLWGDSGAEGSTGGATSPRRHLHTHVYTAQREKWLSPHDQQSAVSPVLTPTKQKPSTKQHRQHRHGLSVRNSKALPFQLDPLFKRSQDNAKNPAISLDMESGPWTCTEWRHLYVGDIILLKEGDLIPVDMVILSTSEEDGTCYVETKNLDGETNLKCKNAPQKTAHINVSDHLFCFSCIIEVEPPGTQLYSFKGSLTITTPIIDTNQQQKQDQQQQKDGDCSTNSTTQKEPLNIDNLLLRGSVLRNTRWAVGVTVFTGVDTKIMMNSGETPSKRSRIERMMNYQVVSQFCLLFALCAISAIIGGVLYKDSGSFQSYFIVKYQTGLKRSSTLFGFLTFWTSLILYQTVVPISLYVTIEIVKSFQAYFINQDSDMYYEKTDSRCIPKSWNLSDDLGQVEYIFSDKTGTLTQNIMEFRQCTIRGKVYGEATVSTNPDRAKQLRHEMVDRMGMFFENKYCNVDRITFTDSTLYDDLQADNSQARSIIEFFTTLALCHSVISETPDPTCPNQVVYKAQSPDEAALVSTACDTGFAFLRRNKDKIQCEFLGHPQTYTQLAVLEFTSARKRMSVIVRRDDGKIMLLCKGADSVIIERVRPSQGALIQATLRDLEMFASCGLRTLCLGYRILGNHEFSSWKQRYDRIMSGLGDREAEVEAVCEEIERDLHLIGGTAIEDKLQEGVPETISQLSLAGIKLWVLTGDKTETAINIGYSCNLLNKDMQIVVVEADDRNSTQAQLERALYEFGSTHADLSYDIDASIGIPGFKKSTNTRNSWKSLLRAPPHVSGSNYKSTALQQMQNLMQEKRHRKGCKGIWDNMRTRNVPSSYNDGLESKGTMPLGLVIDGTSLKCALEPEIAPLFLELAVRCQSVLCCRVSPLQKALVVRLVKEGLGTLCLAIGDGANDVSMIQEADIGIGISGEEGLQAVMASDYAIAQFRFLQKLLLVHGRWSYLRITSMILNFFYKNIVFTISLFWFQFFCQWSVENFFDYTLIMLYNMFFTSLPPSVLGVLDQDLPAAVGIAVPQLYKRGIFKLEYSMTRFWMYIIDGIYQSAAVTFLVVYTYYFSSTAREKGMDNASKDDMGIVCAFCVVLITNLYMGLSNRTWTWVMPVAQFIGVSMLLGVFFVYGTINKHTFSAGASVRIFTQADFWLLLVLTTVVCLLPRYVAKFVRSAWYPTDTDIVREIVHQFRDIQNPSLCKKICNKKYTGLQKRISQKRLHEESHMQSAERHPNIALHEITEMTETIDTGQDSYNIRKIVNYNDSEDPMIQCLYHLSHTIPQGI